MLAATLNEVFAGKTVVLVVAMADDKQHEGVMRGLADVNACEALVLTQVIGHGEEYSAYMPT